MNMICLYIFLISFTSIFCVCHKGKYYVMFIYMTQSFNRITMKNRPNRQSGGAGEQPLAPNSPAVPSDGSMPPPSEDLMPPPSEGPMGPSEDLMPPPSDGLMPPPSDGSMGPPSEGMMPPPPSDGMMPPPSDGSMGPPSESPMGPPPSDGMMPPPPSEGPMGPPEYGPIPTGEEDSPEIKEFREKMSDPANKKDFFYLNKNISTEPNKSKAYIRQGLLHFTDSMGINALRESLTSISNFFGAKGLENAVYDRLRNLALTKVGILLEENQRCYNTRLDFEREDETIFVHVYGTLYVKKE